MITRYFIHDLESDKIHLHTAGKADYQSLPEEVRNNIKSNFLWSGSRNCWVSRAKGGRVWILDQLKANGFEDRGKEGEKLTFAEQLEAKQTKAEERAEFMETRAETAAEKSEAILNRAHKLADSIPLGQPILVGHHSEKRARKDAERIRNWTGKGVAEADKAEYYRGRVTSARATAEGKQYSDPSFLARRIKEQEAEERKILRRLDTTEYSEVITQNYQYLEEIRDKLEFYRVCLASCGVVVFNKETLKDKKMVLVRGRWERIVKLNPKTVAVPNTCFPERESQERWALRYPYSEVKDAK